MITLGIDEVGRGSWAGPLVAGAVVLPANIKVGPIVLRDSKKLSKLQRERLDAIIRTHALVIGLGWVWPAEIDSFGLSAAVGLAMQRACDEVHIHYDEMIIDGNINYFAGNSKARAIVRADDSVPSVSAASIVAKVARDAYMAALGPHYANYGFERHVGYGTAMHMAALKQYGISDIHRLSFRPIASLLT